MRVTCTVDGFTGTWVEVSESWTRAERRLLEAARTDAEFWAIWCVKVTACHIERVGEPPLTAPANVGDEGALDSVDERVLGFLGGAMIRVCTELRSLGNAAGRLSSNGIVPEPAAARSRMK